MRLIDGSGTHTFNSSIISGIDNYSNEKRMNRYKSIDALESENVFGTSFFIQFDFFQLNESERDTLNTIFIDNNLTSIDNFDEVLAGETYKILSGATNSIFITTKSIQFKRSIESKGIDFYNSRLIIRFDSVATATK